jgi:translation initiation factor IF-2
LKKVRIYQLARELKVEPATLLALAQEVDPSVQSQMASVDTDVADQLKARLTGDRSAGKPAARRAESATTTVRRPATPVATAPAVVMLPTLPPLSKAPDFSALLQDVKPVSSAVPPPARPLGPVTPPRVGRVIAHPPTSRPAVAGAPGRTYYPPAPGAPGRTDRAPVGAPDRRGGPPARKDRKKKKRHHEVDEREVADSIRRTMADMEGTRTRRRRRHAEEEGVAAGDEAPRLKLSEFLTVAELASSMNVRPAEVVGVCLRLGIVANVNRRLDKDSIETVADEFGYAIEFVKEFGEEILDEASAAEDETGAVETPRPVIVTVMGHVDHGKTKLLDYIRKTDVISKESGGITQHIGAYQAHLASGGRVTFLDTPGHEAFTAMRARGADVTDVVVLVVAADDRVNEQTLEAINHARAARKPIVVAINKCDLPNADPQRIKKELADQRLLVEEWGGETIAVEISAKLGTNVDRLLEVILLVAEMLELRTAHDRPARGTVIEARKDTGRGIVSTVLVQGGTLRLGDPFVCGTSHGKVRAMVNDLGERVEAAGPSTPVEVLGWSDVPQVGDTFAVVASESVSRVISGERTQIAREHRMKLAANRFRLDDLHTRIQEGQKADLRLIIKGDVQGSVEVLRDSMEKLSSDQVNVIVIHTGAGRINESDVLLAAASNAIVIGFHVRPDPKATQLAQNENVEVRLYKVIYEAIDQVKAAIAGLLAPKERERVLGSAELRQVFQISKLGNIAGCHIITGTITRTASVRLIRNDDVIWTGKIGSLKREKEDVREVAAGFECGLALEGFQDIRVGDLLEAFVIEEVPDTAGA